MNPNTVNVINKNLLKIKNDKQKLLNEQNRELRAIKNQNRVYKEYSDGKISKTDLRLIIEKSERESNEFTQVKLRKIKVDRIQNNHSMMHQDLLQTGEPASMAQLLSLFGSKNAGIEFTNQKTLLGDGNVAPGNSLQPKKRRVNADGDDMSSSDSSAEEDVEVEELGDEEQNQGSAQSFIQILFDSQIKRQFEEDQAKSGAGLSAFKSTGNAMQDAFRRMIEKKLLEKVQSELAKKHEEDEVFKREVQIRTAQREQ